MKEQWRPVGSVKGLLASNTGRLMLSPYEGTLPNGGTRVYGGTVVAGVWSEGRYVTNIRGRNYKVAALVCEAFHGPRPSGLYCLHIDENARNNVASNLKWGTQKENLNAPRFIAYCKSRTGENSTHAKASKAS